MLRLIVGAFPSLQAQVLSSWQATSLPHRPAGPVWLASPPAPLRSERGALTGLSFLSSCVGILLRRTRTLEGPPQPNWCHLYLAAAFLAFGVILGVSEGSKHNSRLSCIHCPLLQKSYLLFAHLLFRLTHLICCFAHTAIYTCPLMPLFWSIKPPRN
jgi:hypothetical protein